MAPKRAGKRARSDDDDGVFELTYFGINGKGTSCALALAHSGLKFKVTFPEDWASLKPTTPWGHLPLLQAPDGSKVGHEFAVLNVIGRTAPAMGGETSEDHATSQQVSACHTTAHLCIVCEAPRLVSFTAYVTGGGHLPEAL